MSWRVIFIQNNRLQDAYICGSKPYLSTTRYRIQLLVECTKATHLALEKHGTSVSYGALNTSEWKRISNHFKSKPFLLKRCTTIRTFFSVIKKNSIKYWSKHQKMRSDKQMLLLLLLCNYKRPIVLAPIIVNWLFKTIILLFISSQLCYTTYLNYFLTWWR